MADLTLITTGNGARAVLPAALSGRSILALDLGTTTGWAIPGFDGLITSGTASFRPGRFDGGGMRYPPMLHRDQPDQKRPRAEHFWQCG